MISVFPTVFSAGLWLGQAKTPLLKTSTYVPHHIGTVVSAVKACDPSNYFPSRGVWGASARTGALPPSFLALG